MIVNYTEQGWEIITQRAHGILAAQLGMNWKIKERPERWLETLLAIAEHDDAQVELEEEDLLTSQGGPLSFSMKKFNLQHAERVSRFSITKSRYIALLTSMHMDFLFRKEEQTNSEVSEFLQEQRRLQNEWIRDLKLKKEAVKSTYSFLEWCDAFSLLICQKQLQPENRSIEVSQGPDGNRYQLYQVNEKTLTINPWPFELQLFTVSYESRVISQLQFKDAAEFRKAFNEAKIVETIWEIVKSKPPGEPQKV